MRRGNITEVINSFINGFGKITTPNQSLSNLGDKLFSYNTCIAEKTEYGIIVVNKTRYSNTTSKHQSYILRSLKNIDVEIIDRIPINTKSIANLL